MSGFVDKTITVAGDVAKEAVDDAAAGVKEVYDDGKEALLVLPNMVGDAFESIENLPKTVTNKVNELQETTTALVKVPEQVGSIVGDLTTIVGDSVEEQSEKIEGAVVKGAEGVIGTVGKAGVESLKAIPVVGVGVAAGKGAVDTGIVLLNSFRDLGNVATQIVNNITEKAKTNILNRPTEQSKTEKKVGGQYGGAKTRRHLKNIIRDRELIQTRTNKMIREFMNPTHRTTQNKKHISKKSKRRRRR
jgi:hypothetical protein